jgi:chromosome segregation ATPase
MAVSAQNVCQQLLEQLRFSNLNFMISETPYSAKIFLRKRFLKNANGPAFRIQPNSSSTPEFLDQILEQTKILDENSNLKTKIKELGAANKTANVTIPLLEEKLAKAEASALKCFKEKSEEILTLKSDVKNKTHEIENSRKDLSIKVKEAKEKEKEIYRLDQKCENLEDTVKRSKSTVSDLKSENKSLLKDKKPDKKKLYKFTLQFAKLQIQIEERNPPWLSQPRMFASNYLSS